MKSRRHRRRTKATPQLQFPPASILSANELATKAQSATHTMQTEVSPLYPVNTSSETVTPSQPSSTVSQTNVSATLPQPASSSPSANVTKDVAVPAKEIVTTDPANDSFVKDSPSKQLPHSSSSLANPLEILAVSAHLQQSSSSEDASLKPLHPLHLTNFPHFPSSPSLNADSIVNAVRSILEDGKKSSDPIKSEVAKAWSMFVAPPHSSNYAFLEEQVQLLTQERDQLKASLDNVTIDRNLLHQRNEAAKSNSSLLCIYSLFISEFGFP